LGVVNYFGFLTAPPKASNRMYKQKFKVLSFILYIFDILNLSPTNLSI
jgi:hypothetical protein